MTYGTEIYTVKRTRRGLSAKTIVKLIAFFLAMLIREIAN